MDIINLDFVFFFQAEDGIRDYKVTGVQKCALPISRLSAGVSSATCAVAAVAAAVPGGHPLEGQIVKVAGAVDPPPPPPVHTVVQPTGAGDGGLKTVTLAVKLVVPGLTSRSAVAIGWI